MSVSLALVLPVATSLLIAMAETVTYTYDALGRLVVVEHSGSTNNGLEFEYQLDDAGNRTRVVVTGSVNSSSLPRPVVVLPLHGFAIIPIDPNSGL